MSVDTFLGVMANDMQGLEESRSGERGGDAYGR